MDNPRHALEAALPAQMPITNRPLLQALIEPYEQKLAFFYVFYVVSNSSMMTKAEEQVKLINNSMPFIKVMDPSTKKKRCNT